MPVWFETPAYHGARVRGRAAVSAHLMADTMEELIALARAIGLKPEWIQNPGTAKEHFDLMGEGMCSKAEMAGAQRVTRTEFVERYRAKKAKEPKP